MRVTIFMIYRYFLCITRELRKSLRERAEFDRRSNFRKAWILRSFLEKIGKSYSRDARILDRDAILWFDSTLRHHYYPMSLSRLQFRIER